MMEDTRLEDIRLEEQVRSALAPTPTEMYRMQDRLQQTIRAEAVWRTFTTVMILSSRNIQGCIAHSQATAVSAAQYYRLGG